MNQNKYECILKVKKFIYRVNFNDNYICFSLMVTHIRRNIKNKVPIIKNSKQSRILKI